MSVEQAVDADGLKLAQESLGKRVKRQEKYLENRIKGNLSMGGSQQTDGNESEASEDLEDVPDLRELQELTDSVRDSSYTREHLRGRNAYVAPSETAEERTVRLNTEKLVDETRTRISEQFVENKRAATTAPPLRSGPQQNVFESCPDDCTPGLAKYLIDNTPGDIEEWM
ncbi:hypothetical protein CYMTET_41923 [Cymbomonas tetramitiformis]|uniref:Uncharacterized protein n=1 Tax=Cymbomonas tetramitiformis TaxID=36881 RepID=A0AAE0F259_9CHLO|nr:hypothetical protein CYMTET_41923 [Cymbomonas tetramitiformis]